MDFKNDKLCLILLEMKLSEGEDLADVDGQIEHFQYLKQKHINYNAEKNELSQILSDSKYIKTVNNVPEGDRLVITSKYFTTDQTRGLNFI